MSSIVDMIWAACWKISSRAGMCVILMVEASIRARLDWRDRYFFLWEKDLKRKKYQNLLRERSCESLGKRYARQTEPRLPSYTQRHAGATGSDKRRHGNNAVDAERAAV